MGRKLKTVLALFYSPHCHYSVNRGSFGRASDGKARCNTNMGSSLCCSKEFVFQSQISAQTLVTTPVCKRMPQYLYAC